MPYFLCDILGDGSEESPFRPALADLTAEAWGVTVDGRANPAAASGLMLVRAPHLVAFDAAAGIRPLRRALLAQLGAADEGEDDDWDSPGLARKTARRLLVRQVLKADDLGLSLTAKLAELDAPLLRIRTRLLALQPRRPLDLAGIGGQTSVGDALAAILPQIDLTLESAKPRPSGTFGDTFNNTGGSMVNLESWTPTGPNAGAGWTRVGGSAGKAQASNASQTLANITGGSSTLYQCDDQGSADQYVEFTAFNQGVAFAGCNRADAAENFVGIRFNASQLQLAKFVSGSFTSLGTASAATTNVLRLESSGNSHDTFIDGSPSGIGTVTESHNNTVTRQGVSARSTATYSFASTFEAGVLASGTSGEIASTLGEVAAAIAGAPRIVGALASTIAEVAAALEGTPRIEGALAAQLGEVAAALAGAPRIAGALAATLGEVAAALAGTPRITGALASTLGEVVGDLTSEEAALTGEIDGQLGAVVAALVGAPRIVGALASTIPEVTAALAGTPRVSGALAATLGEVTAELAGAPRAAGALTATLDAIVAAIAGSPIVTGALAATLGDVVCEITAVEAGPGTVGLAAGGASLAFAFGGGSMTATIGP